jgi:hypothetical protein
MIQVRVYNIVWASDGLKASHLPTETVIAMDDDCDPHMEAADALRDHYGFCVSQLKIEVQEDV